MAFIYLPAINVTSAVFGPTCAGICGVVWGIVGGLLSTAVTFTIENKVWMLLTGLWSAVTFTLSLSKLSLRALKPKVLVLLVIYPIVVVISPAIFILIKLSAVFKKEYKIIQAQKNVASSGEAMLEAAPQFGPQLYVVYLTMSPTWSQLFSITTSVYLSL